MTIDIDCISARVQHFIGSFHYSLLLLLCSWYSSIKVSKLEPELRDELQLAQPNLTKVYYNKGL